MKTNRISKNKIKFFALATLLLILFKTPKAYSKTPIRDTQNTERTLSFLLREVDTPYQLPSERIPFATTQIREGLQGLSQLTLKQYPWNETKFPSEINHQQLLTSLLWGLFHLSVQKNQGFDQGTLVIEDPDQILFKFLIDSEHAYARPSSHFLFSDCKINQYGIDLYGEWEEDLHSWIPAPTAGMMSFFKARAPLPVLPTNKTHILFGQLPAGPCTLLPTHHVFIKPEDFGLGDFRSYLKHTRDYLASRNVISRPLHGNFFQVERIDSNWLERFESLLRSNSLSTEKTQVKDHLKKAQQYGLRYMISQASQIHESPQTPYAQELAKEFTETFTRRNLDHLDRRTGKEVIFSWSDLLMTR